jgi:hypothetical protein
MATEVKPWTVVRSQLQLSGLVFYAGELVGFGQDDEKFDGLAAEILAALPPRGKAIGSSRNPLYLRTRSIRKRIFQVGTLPITSACVWLVADVYSGSDSSSDSFSDLPPLHSLFALAHT